MSKTRVMPCTCSNEAQDKAHGKGNRVYNECKLASNQYGYRCTVCSKEKE
jgi:hypothetical protein